MLYVISCDRGSHEFIEHRNITKIIDSTVFGKESMKNLQ